MASKTKKDIMSANPKTGGNDKLPKVSELFNVAKIPKDFINVRLMPGFVSYCVHWIDIKGSKSGKDVTIPRVCLDYNPETDSMDDNGCPYCKAGLKAGVRYLFNAIDRDLQDDMGKKSPKYSKDETKAKHLIAGTRSNSPVVVLDLPPGQVDRLKKHSNLNKVKTKKGKEAVSIQDVEHGVDISISFDKDAKGNNYDIQKGERTPLTEKELELLLWNIESMDKIYKANSLDAAKADFKELKKVMTNKVEDGDEYDSDDSKKKKSKKKSEYESEMSEESESEDKKKSKKKKGKKEESEEDSENESDVGSEESSEESESEDKKKKSKGKKSKKDESEESESEESSENESEESEESEEDSESEDKKKSKKKKGKKEESEESESEESEEEDSEEESEEESESEEKSKKKKSSKKRK